MEANKLYVANISFEATEDDLQSLFGEYGTVEQVHYAHDRDTGRPRGFGFITMASAQEAQAAVHALNCKIVNDRELHVSIARPREEKPREQGNFRRGGSPDRSTPRRSFSENSSSNRASNFRPDRPPREEQRAPRLDGREIESRHPEKNQDTRRNTVFRTHDEEWPKGHKPKKRFDDPPPKRNIRNWEDEDDD